MAVNFQQLYHLQTILQEGSISKAAQKLYTTQPALSRQLRMIEKEAGITILERTVPVRTTYEGERYMHFVDRVLEEYRSMEKELRIMAGQDKGCLTVGSSRNRAEQFLPYILPEFRKTYPGIRITLKEDFSADNLDKFLLEDEIDMICMTQNTDIPGIHFEPLLREEIHLAVPAAYYPYGAGEKRILNLRDFAGTPFILMKKGYRIREISDRILARHKIQPPVVMETSSTAMAYKMASEGMGVTFVSTLTIAAAQIPQKPYIFSVSPEKYIWLLGCAFRETSANKKNILLFLDSVRGALLKPPFTELMSENKLLVL